MQERLGSRAALSAMEGRGGFPREVTDDLVLFLGRLRSFYIASATKDGKPYIQHRGGPRGFLKVLDPRTLGFADFSGNRQYITLGRLAENDAVCLFMMDYARRARVKVWGRARAVEGDTELMARLTDPAYRARAERAVVIEIDAWSQTCSPHIPHRFEAEDVVPVIEELQDRVRSLEAENAKLREALG